MRALAGTVLLTALLTTPGSAQWHVGLEIGTVRYRGTSRDTSGSSGGAYLGPGDAVLYGIRVGRQLGRVAVALRAFTGTPGIAGVAPGVTLTDKTTGRLLEIVPSVGIRAASVGSGGVLAVEGGPAVAVWDIDGEARGRVGPFAALAYLWPVAQRFTGSIRVEGS